jgi:hypothetical protein
VRIKVYIEGGGDSSLQDAQFREAWHQFFKKAQLQRMPGVVRGKGRSKTWDLFKTAVENRQGDDVLILIVDSEELVVEGRTVWQHLQNRAADNWTKPEAAGTQDAFLMICCMETWLLADHSALQTVFKQHFNPNSIPKWPDLEKVPKSTIYATLKKASSDKYAKSKICWDLLGEVDPLVVETKCTQARLLLDRLRAL